METVSFRPVSEFKAVTDAVFEEQKKRILDRLPFAQIHHVGSTAIPNSLTKGDLDVNVQVDKENFNRAIHALKQIYEINQPNNWTDNFASFKDDKNLAIDFGVQLTVIGSPDDVYVSNRDFLLKHPEVVEQLNELKKKYEGKSMNEYRKEKGEFFNKIVPPSGWICMSCGAQYPHIEIKSNWFLVRHGETDWNKGETDRSKIERIQGSSDTHLTEHGKMQAKATAELLKDKHIDLIISSDLARAKQTAEIIAEATGAELILDKSLREMDFGILEGMPIPEVNEKYGGFLDRPYKELGGETFEEVEARAMEALHDHKKDYHNKNIVIVTHGALLGLVMKNIKKLTHAKSSGLKIANAEAIKLEIGDPCKKCGEDLYESNAGN